MTYPPHDDRLRHLIAQEINPHVASWKLAFFIADGIVTSREVRGELKRIAEAHAAAEHCGDRNCEHCWTASVTAEDPAPVLPEPADRAAILREAADTVDAMNEGCSRRQPCGACNAREDAADSLRRMADGAQQGEPRPDTPRCAHCTHPKGDHSDRKDHTPSPTVPRRPWCHACNATCDYDEQPADEAQQPETQAEDRAAIIAEILPTWEAVYEPGNVSDYLIGYANSEAGAKGAAEAWLRSEKDEPGRLEWVPQTPLDGYDQESELIERHDDGIDTGPGITVRHRTQKPTA